MKRNDPILVDGYGRIIDYLRISVTDRCNLRCLYCMPRHGVQFICHRDILRYEEILKIADVFIGLGIKKIRITGGEPLIRRDILFLIDQLGKRDGLREITLTTNGLLLRGYAEKLRKTGITRVNVSVDTLNRARFEELTGCDCLDQVLEGIKMARDAGLQVKLNIVGMRGINDGEYADFVRFGIEQGCNMRFIEVMPQVYNDGFSSDLYISGNEILKIIAQSYRLITLSPANLTEKERLFQPEGYDLKLGFISPISDPFCSRCNRLRLMPDGVLKPCLFSDNGVNLKDLLRHNRPLNDIRKAIFETVRKKPKKHNLGCGDVHLVMHRTGG